MAGLGNVAPVIEMKALYKKISDEYRIAVVDRAGYGFSDISGDSRDIDTILDETRKTLSLSGEKPPYVLFPHSISGLELIYWAQLNKDVLNENYSLEKNSKKSVSLDLPTKTPICVFIATPLTEEDKNRNLDKI